MKESERETERENHKENREKIERIKEREREREIDRGKERERKGGEGDFHHHERSHRSSDMRGQCVGGREGERQRRQRAQGLHFCCLFCLSAPGLESLAFTAAHTDQGAKGAGGFEKRARLDY